MKLDEVVQVSTSVAATPGRLEKIAKLAALVSRLSPDEVPVAVGFFISWPKQGRLGVAATVAAARERSSAAAATLELADVDKVFDQLLSARGKNSASERVRLLGDLSEVHLTRPDPEGSRRWREIRP